MCFGISDIGQTQCIYNGNLLIKDLHSPGHWSHILMIQLPGVSLLWIKIISVSTDMTTCDTNVVGDAKAISFATGPHYNLLETVDRLPSCNAVIS